MDTVEIIVTCQHCRKENLVTIERADKYSPKCLGCAGILMTYTTVNGYIYILSNPKMKNLLKIGLSTRPIQERIAELSSATRVPAPFELEAYFLSTNPEVHEKQIHAALAQYRVNGKEFFEVSISKASEVAESICKGRCFKSSSQMEPRNSYETPYDSEYEYRKRARQL
jgi:T5orf172 domain